MSTCAERTLECTHRCNGASILLMMVSIISITLVLAFAFLRTMQFSRGTSVAQRKDDLARLSAEMAIQHAAAVCIHDYAMEREKRDNVSVAPLSRHDSPHAIVFQPLTRRLSSGSINTLPPKNYDLGLDLPFQNLFHYMFGGGNDGNPTRLSGYYYGSAITPGYARIFEANRFHYQPTAANAEYRPETYDFYDAAAAAAADATGGADLADAVESAFKPVAPFVRGTAITRRHPSDNPLLLDADCRPVSQVKDARYRLRYAAHIQDMSGSLWLNTDMPWLTTADKTACRNAYKEAVYAVGRQMGGQRGDTFQSIFMGYGAYANTSFTNGQPREWPSRGGDPCWYRWPTRWSANVTNNRILQCVLGSPLMNWNDGANWIGSAIPSYNDLGFALSNPTDVFHTTGEVAWNESRIRGDLDAQFCATPFGRPNNADTDHPWSINAVMVSPRVLGAIVRAYIPPVIRTVEAIEESYIGTPIKPAQPTTQPTPAMAFNSAGGNYTLPANAGVTIIGKGVDLFTDAFSPRGKIPFNHPTPPLRDYWSTPTGPFASAADRATWRPDHQTPTDTRPNTDRYPGPLFFSVPAKEPLGQALTRWRWNTTWAPPSDALGLTIHDGTKTNPRQVMNDPMQTYSSPAAPAWVSGTRYDVDARVTHEDTEFICKKTMQDSPIVNVAGVNAKNVAPPANGIYWDPICPPNPPVAGVDHLGRHIVFYRPDGGGSAAAMQNNAKYLSPGYWGVTTYTDATEIGAKATTPATIRSANGTRPKESWARSFLGSFPFSRGNGTWGDAFISLYDTNISQTTYSPPDPDYRTPAGETYPDPTGWTMTARLAFLRTAPEDRGAYMSKVSQWQISRKNDTYGVFPIAAYPNSYYSRVGMAFLHAIGVTQQANLAWANNQDARSRTVFNGGTNCGVMYTATPDTFTAASYKRKGALINKHASDPKTADTWLPAAADFSTTEMIDRQFVANLGESFDSPGKLTPEEARSSRPPRYAYATGSGSDASYNTMMASTNMVVAEYRVTNNIRTLLTPIDTVWETAGTVSGAANIIAANPNNPPLGTIAVPWTLPRPAPPAAITLTPSSTDPQTGNNMPPHRTWLLDEWNAGSDASYTPGVTVGASPTLIARARAKMMERVLNDWRLSFLGSCKDYAAGFKPKDFDGDGRVFCSGYLDALASAADADCGLTCWQPADASGNGPGKSSGLTIFSVTGCIGIQRSNQFKIHVRGELYDNFLDRAVSELYLESTLLVDPDGNVTRRPPAVGPPLGLEDTTIIQQRPIHNYYRGYLNRSYP